MLTVKLLLLKRLRYRSVTVFGPMLHTVTLPFHSGADSKNLGIN